MKPLTLKYRRVVFALFFVLFVAVLAITVVYASGYRLRGLELERTGGIYVSVPIIDAGVFMDGESVGVTGLLTRSFFIDNLEAGQYDVEVIADGYYPWKKTFIVDRALVTDAGAFMVPEKFDLLPIVARTSEPVATTTRVVSQVDYQKLLEAFGLVEAEASVPEKTSRPKALELEIREGNVYVKWNKSLAYAPNGFCIRPSACVVEVSVEYGVEEVVAAEFYAGGIVYQTKDGVIFLSEIDVKQPQLLVPLYESQTATFRVYNGELIILDEDEFFVLSGI